MASDTVVGLLNFVLSVFTLAIVLHFWWRHRSAGFARSWWVMAFAFGIFVVSETFGAIALLSNSPAATAFSLSVRLLFMATLIAGLYRVFENVLDSQQRALADAQHTIRLQAEAVARAQEAQLLARITERLTASLDLEIVLQELCREARELTGADSVSVRLPEETAGGFRFAVDFASALKSRPEYLNAQIDELAWKVAQAGRPAVIEDAKAHPMFGPQSPDWLGALGAFPVRRSGDIIGVLTVVFDKPRPFPLEQQRMLSALADQAAIAVRNAQLHETVEQSARTDHLTGLSNRRSFNEALTAEIRRARRYNLPLALIMADVDKLKAVNDRHGHLAGDTLLIAVAQSLRNTLRATDFPARFGGDEFVVILPGTTIADAHRIADRIRQEAARLAFDWNGSIVPVNLSLGVGGGQGESLPEAPALLAAADHDLYHHKSGAETSHIEDQ
jgi:diguanylate cyclase (GGDEF)-like protein